MNPEGVFLEKYQQAARHIEAEIERSLDDNFATTFPKQDTFYNEVKRFAGYGGKRFRPALSLRVAQAFGRHEVLPHLALEVFHKYLLAHDDIIDRDVKRYGKPTIHAKMSALQKGEGASHFGNSLAIIGGDLLIAATHKIILDSNLPDTTKIALQKLIVQAVEEVAWGWYDQFLMDYLPLDSDKLSFERIETSTIWVTGKYSIKLPLLFGYTVAGKSAPKGLEALADVLGILYQAGDDVIGLFGEEESTGKSNYGDILQGKKTLPMYLAYEGANADDKKVLASVVGKKTASQKEIAEVRAILQRSGGLERTKTLMHDYSARAKTELEDIKLPAELRTFLRGFISFIESRKV